MKLHTKTALAVLGLFSTSAHAADLDPIIPSYGFYGSLFGGVNFLDSADVSIEEQNTILDEDFGRVGFNTGIVVGGAFGLELLPGWRSEVEVSYRQNEVSSYYEGIENRNLASSGDVIGALAIMANVWKDFQFSDTFGAHMGGGIGAANLDLTMANVHAGGGTIPLNDDVWVLAGQAGAGLDWVFGNNMVASIDYRLFVTEKASFVGRYNNGSFTFSHDYMSHSIMAGLRIPLGGN